MKTLLSVAAVATALGTGSVQAEIERHDFNVQSEPGIQLQVRDVGDSQAAAGKPPIILLHGARVPGHAR